MQEDNIIRDKPGATELNLTNPTIEFRNVYFKYSEKTDNHFNIQSSNQQDGKQVGTANNGTAIVTPTTNNWPNAEPEPENKIDTNTEEGANGNTYQEWILQDVSFTIQAGTSTALVGATGSGKSTCVRLL